MGYKKCPRCELNYIRDDQQLCDVCSRKRKASDDDNEVLMCIECGENPAMKGKELCAACYKESLRQERLGKQHKTIAHSTKWIIQIWRTSACPLTKRNSRNGNSGA